MSLDATVTLANFVLTASLLALLLWKRLFRVLPTFVAYLGYSFLFALASLAVLYNPSVYLIVWTVGIAIDTLFYLCVLIELGKSVLGYNRASPWPRGAIILLFMAACLPIWLLAQWPTPPRLPMTWQLNFRVMQGTAILEVAGILTLAWWSHIKDLRWPERQLRLVMGLAVWPLVELSALMLHEHGFIGRAYHWLDLLTPAAVLGVFIYWLHYFWLEPTAEAEDRLAKHRIMAAAGPSDGDDIHSNRTCSTEQA